MKPDMETMKKFTDMAAVYLVKYGFQVLIALVILFVGWKIAEWVGRLLDATLRKKHIDVTLAHFIGGVAKMAVFMFAVLVAVEKIGITISPFIATLSAMIFGASFAIQAPLSNYAAGLTIIFTHPFVVGNTITIKGYSGVVKEVKLAATILTTADGETVTIPNKDIVGEVIVNSLENHVAETSVGISYSDDPEKAIRVARAVLARFSQILKDPAPLIGIKEFGDFAVVIGVRYWAPTTQYLSTLHDVNLALYRGLSEAGVTIPFPRRDIRILEQPNKTGQ